MAYTIIHASRTNLGIYDYICWPTYAVMLVSGLCAFLVKSFVKFINALHPECYNITCVVSVKTSDGVVKRASHKYMYVPNAIQPNFIYFCYKKSRITQVQGKYVYTK